MALNNPVLTRASAVVSLGPAVHAVLRVGAALLFMQHGFQKLFGWLGGQTVPLASQLGIAGVLELVGGFLIVIGLLTRPVALVLAVEMVAAYFIAHAARAPWPVQNGGELALLYALIFAFIAANGAGWWSADRALNVNR